MVPSQKSTRCHANTQPVVVPPLDFRTSNTLLTSIARIENNPVPVLFDGGSQVNTISASMALRFNLQTKPLTQKRRILFPNGQSTEITHYVERLVITFPALRPNNEFIRFIFHCFHFVIGYASRNDSWNSILTVLQHYISPL